jgi:hypothetical protein
MAVKEAQGGDKKPVVTTGQPLHRKRNRAATFAYKSYNILTANYLLPMGA